MAPDKIKKFPLAASYLKNAVTRTHKEIITVRQHLTVD